MQTFITEHKIKNVAKILDYRRLGKQRVEAKQILQAIRYKKSGNIYMVDKNGRERLRGWLNHPCTEMWHNYESYLAYYGYVMCREWINRGYNDSLKSFFRENIGASRLKDIEEPYWLRDESLHISHQSNLLNKDRGYYSCFFDVKDDLEYVWFPRDEQRGF